MDPNLFHLDGERLFEVLVAIVVLSFFVERALALVFEHRLYVKYFGGRGFKEVISFVLAFVICRAWDFGALSIVIVAEKTQIWGHAMTAAIVAGGSKASIKFFHDVMKTMSDAEAERKGLEAAKKEAKADA